MGTVVELFAAAWPEGVEGAAASIPGLKMEDIRRIREEGGPPCLRNADRGVARMCDKAAENQPATFAVEDIEGSDKVALCVQLADGSVQRLATFESRAASRTFWYVLDGTKVAYHAMGASGI